MESVTSLTKCSLCYETLKEPKILKCFHTFCKNCLVAHAELKEEGKTFSCPSCQTNIDLPQCSDFDSLESSSFHSRILEVLSIATSTKASSGVICSACKNPKPLTSHCLNCARSLCVQCLNAHNVFMAGHQIINLTELQVEDYNVLIRRQSNCERSPHSEEILQFYCNTCESCVCPKCILQNHQHGHDLVDIEAKAEMLKLLLNERLQRLKKKETEEETNYKGLEETVSKIKSAAEESKTNVMKAAEDLIAFIEQNKRDLMRQIDEEVQMGIRKKAEQESLLPQIRGAREYVSKLLEYGSAHLILTTHDSVQNRYEELIAIEKDWMTEIDYRVVFFPSEGPTRLREVGLGSLSKTKLTDPAMSTVQVESKLAALSDVKLSVFTKTFAGEPNNDPDDVVEVNISPKEDVKLIQISERIGEKYEVEFTPKVPGQFTADVKINGKRVSNSPLVMDVNPQQLKITGELAIKEMTGTLIDPVGIAVNKGNTRIAITDCNSHCIAVFNMEGVLLNKFGSRGSRRLNHPRGIAFLNDNDVVVVDEHNHRIQIFDSTTGKSIKSFGRPGHGRGEFSNPEGVHVDEQGCIIVSDCYNKRVQVVTADGSYLFEFGLGEHEEDMYPASTITHGELFIVSDLDNDVIHVFDLQDNIPTRRYVIGRPGSEDGELSDPRGLAVDNNGNLLVCDYGNYRIQKFTLDGRFVGKTSENIGAPYNLAVLADGRIIVTDRKTQRTLYIR